MKGFEICQSIRADRYFRALFWKSLREQPVGYL